MKKKKAPPTTEGTPLNKGTKSYWNKEIEADVVLFSIWASALFIIFITQIAL
jgi:hypothetical protein